MEFHPVTHEIITEKIVEDVTEPVIQIIDEVNELQCDVCGFIAKSNAGLAVHKQIHK